MPALADLGPIEGAGDLSGPRVVHDVGVHRGGGDDGEADGKQGAYGARR